MSIFAPSKIEDPNLRFDVALPIIGLFLFQCHSLVCHELALQKSAGHLIEASYHVLERSASIQLPRMSISLGRTMLGERFRKRRSFFQISSYSSFF